MQTVEGTLVKVNNHDILLDGSFVVPAEITSIGFSAVQLCINLQTLNLPEGITSIGDLAFLGCSQLHSIELPQSIMTIGIGAFMDCNLLQAPILPAGITTIGCAAFMNCSSLQTLNLPMGIAFLGEAAFMNCRSLRTLNLPVGITTIGYATFRSCSNLQSLELPMGITSIGSEAFQACTSLRVLRIPATVIEIGKAFVDCTHLETIIIDGSDEDCERIALLLSKALQNKVIPQRLAEKANQFIQEQMTKVAYIAQINPLYKFLNINLQVGELSKMKYISRNRKVMEYELLPDEILAHINGFMSDELPVYRQAQSRMLEVPLPGNESQLEDYRDTLDGIANQFTVKHGRNSGAFFYGRATRLQNASQSTEQHESQATEGINNPAQNMSL